MKILLQTAVRVGGREGVRGAGDDFGDGQGGRLLRWSGRRLGRVLGAADREGQGALGGKDVPRRKSHQGKKEEASTMALQALSVVATTLVRVKIPFTRLQCFGPLKDLHSLKITGWSECATVSLMGHYNGHNYGYKTYGRNLRQCLALRWLLRPKIPILGGGLWENCSYGSYGLRVLAKNLFRSHTTYRVTFFAFEVLSL